MNDTIMTIVGNVVDQPRTRKTKSGHAVSNFRVASTSRRFDREQQRYVDNATLFVNVTCWRAMGENVDQSVRKGHPVVVYGRFYTRDYVVNEQVRTSYELEAMAVGHDLSRGVSKFDRVYRPAPTVTVTRDEDGIPVDDSDHWLDLADPSADDAAPSVGDDDIQSAHDEPQRPDRVLASAS
ncbi:single-stranded DNA-binding protein [uncultured Jatrophihabitans sp.]|uniref:single-stranded DNA-binding protein n=1 Tax=uncultured Jatrophihabitans sp. TaxID=1610747 RepID=UPI0035CB8E7D